MFKGKNRQKGGVAVEYMIVSSFGILLSIAAVSYVSKVIKEKVSKIEQETGQEFKFEGDLFEEG